MKPIREYLEEIWDITQSDMTDFNKRTQIVNVIADIRENTIEHMSARHLKLIEETFKTK